MGFSLKSVKKAVKNVVKSPMKTVEKAYKSVMQPVEKTVSNAFKSVMGVKAQEEMIEQQERQHQETLAQQERQYQEEVARREEEQKRAVEEAERSKAEAEKLAQETKERELAERNYSKQVSQDSGSINLENINNVAKAGNIKRAIDYSGSTVATVQDDKELDKLRRAFKYRA